MNKTESVVKYYVLCNKLKDVVRTGWKDWNVSRDRVESVAEHTYGVQMLAIAMKSQYEYDIDLGKVILMHCASFSLVQFPLDCSKGKILDNYFSCVIMLFTAKLL